MHRSAFFLTSLLLWASGLGSSLGLGPSPAISQPGDTYTRGAIRPWTVADSAIVRTWMSIGLGHPPTAPGVSTAWSGAASGPAVKVDSVKFRGQAVDPPCTPAREGLEIYNSTEKRKKYCTGQEWRTAAVDQDEDGLTLELDADEGVPFTPGTAGADDVLSGRTFYSGEGMVEETGAISATNAGDLATVEVDLIPANIRTAFQLFGLTGTYPSAGNPLPGGTTDVTAAAAQVLSGYEAWTEAGDVVDGTMPDRGAPTYTTPVPSTSPVSVALALGYHAGGDCQAPGDVDLVPDHIKDGVVLFDVTGTYPSVASPLPGSTADTTVTSAQILVNYEAWTEAGAVVDGTMPNRNSPVYTTPVPSTSTVSVALNPGYHSGGDCQAPGDSDLVPGKVRDGVNLFGVLGTYPSVSDPLPGGTADATATGAQVLVDHEAWTETGAIVDGTMPNRGSPVYTTPTPSTSTVSTALAPGYHAGGDCQAPGDADLVPGKVRGGVDLFGVLGTYPSVSDPLPGGTADATATGAQVLVDYEAWTETGAVIDGTMPNRGSPVYTTPVPSTSTVSVALNPGYHSGGDCQAPGDTDLVPGQIRNGIDLFGVVGAFPSVSVPLPGGTADANAAAAQVLVGYEAWTDAGTVVDGSMPNRGSPVYTTPVPSTSTVSVALNAGYHAGGGCQAPGDADLVPGKIRDGVVLFGVTGTYPSPASPLPGGTTDATAVAGQLLTGYEAWTETGAHVDGTMPNRGTVNLTPTTSNQAIASGYHTGAGVVYGDADLVSGNIRAGANVFGVAGDGNVVNTATGTAAAADLLSGRIAWVDGAQISGSISATQTGNLTTVDGDLAVANIRNGVTVLGVTGAFPSASHPLPGGTPDATGGAGQLLAGYEAWTETGAHVDGTMPNRGTVNLTPTTSNQAIASGYHTGSGVVYGDADLVPGKIKDGVALFGVTGDYPSPTYPLPGGTADATATGAQILAGYEAWTEAGGGVDGTMPNRGSPTYTTPTPSTTTVSAAISAGYHAGGTCQAPGDPDLESWNIRAGVNVFGVTGNLATSASQSICSSTLAPSGALIYDSCNDGLQLNTDKEIICRTICGMKTGARSWGFGYYDCSGGGGAYRCYCYNGGSTCVD